MLCLQEIASVDVLYSIQAVAQSLPLSALGLILNVDLDARH